MKKLFILLCALIATFAGVWIFKSRTPSNRPDSYQNGIVGNYWWNSTEEAKEVDNNWQLSSDIPADHVPVPGRKDLYMIVDENGYITGYVRGTLDENGRWIWEETDPNIPEYYEAVPGLENVYKVTNEDGSVSYFKYIRNKDDTYAFVEVDAKGNPINEAVPSGSQIPDNYERVTGNKYAVKNTNGVVIGYKERVLAKEANGDSSYEWKNINEPTLEEIPKSDSILGFDLRTDVTGTGDITGGVKEHIGYTDIGNDNLVVPTLPPTTIASADTQGGFVFSSPVTQVTTSEYIITTNPNGFSDRVTQTGSVARPEGNMNNGAGLPNMSIEIQQPQQGSTINIPTGSTTTGNVQTNPGQYVTTETVYTEKQEGNYIVRYATSKKTTYTMDGIQVGQPEMGSPVEVSRKEIKASANVNSTPASTIKAEQDRITAMMFDAGGKFNAKVPNDMAQLLNKARQDAGLNPLVFSGSSKAYTLALCRASLMAMLNSNSNNLGVYGTVENMCSKYGIQTSYPSENMLILSSISADAIHSVFQTSNNPRMSPNYKEVAIAIVEMNGKYYIDEIIFQ